MRIKTSTLLVILLLSHNAIGQNKYTISGYIKEKGSLESLIGVNVNVKGQKIGTSSNTYGFYSLTLPASNSLILSFSYVGFETVEKEISLTKNTDINIELSSLNILEEVVVSAKKEADRVSENVQMSQIELPIQQIKKIPSFLGEKDVLRVLQLMPGVQKGSEGQTGIYVRGGGPDQNLIILDDANVYNANHLFGFFSVFNGDALKSVELTKGGFPARYGGRLSSVIDLNMKEGNKKKLSGEGGIGLISSRLTLEGPIIKNKASFLISARRTYADVLAKPFIAASQKNQDSKTDPGYYFYDLNAKLNFEISKKDKIYLSGYFGKDKFDIYNKGLNDTVNAGLNWGNATSTLRWNHLFSPKLFSNLSFIFTDYKFNIFSEEKSRYSSTPYSYSLNYRSSIRDFGFKYDFDYFPNPNHAVKIGTQGTYHIFKPSAIVVKGSNTGDNINTKQKETEAIEAGIYAEDIWNATERLKLNYGLRFSNYQTIGKTYIRPEPRMAVAYKIRSDMSAKASYAKMNQYVHLLTNSGLGLPTDLWVPTTQKVAPQTSEQIAAGIAKDFKDKGLSLTIEGYYKKMNNILSYKEGSSFLFFDDPQQSTAQKSWEDNVTAGKAWSYGSEFLLQKKYGKLSGWLGYTLSWTQWKFNELNFGKIFFPKYDRRHDVSVVGIYELNKRITLSSTWVYGTGNALTIPIGSYKSSEHIGIPPGNFFSSPGFENAYYPLASQLFGPYRNIQEFGEKNTFRAEPYHRLDLGVQFHKQLKTHERTWEISFYNAYNRKNPFFYQLEDVYTKNTGQYERTALKRYSVFPIVPSFSYNFKF